MIYLNKKLFFINIFWYLKKKTKNKSTFIIYNYVKNFYLTTRNVSHLSFNSYNYIKFIFIMLKTSNITNKAPVNSWFFEKIF